MKFSVFCVCITVLALIAAVLWSTRYQMQAVGGAGGLYVLDRWTGKVQHCMLGDCNPAGVTRPEPNVFDKYDADPVLKPGN